MPKPKRWEIAEGDWKGVLEAVHREMISIARGVQTISHSDLVGRVGHFAGPDSHALAECWERSTHLNRATRHNHC